GTAQPQAPEHAGRRRWKRRGRDLNPRSAERRITVFATAAFDRSATPPRPLHGSARRGAAPTRAEDGAPQRVRLPVRRDPARPGCGGADGEGGIRTLEAGINPT